MNREMIQRLSRYKSLLQKLKGLGFVKVFSDNLGDAAGLTSALVRKDFAAFGLAGNKRGGYRVDELIERLNVILGKDAVQRIIIVGCGKIGTALINYQGFAREGIQVAAGFDVKPDRLNPAAPVPILDLGQVREFIRRERIQVAIMTVPEGAAATVLDMLLAAGIRGVLNFASVQLKAPETVFVQNLNLAQDIENLFGYVRFAEKNGALKARARAPRGAAR